MDVQKQQEQEEVTGNTKMTKSSSPLSVIFKLQEIQNKYDKTLEVKYLTKDDNPERIITWLEKHIDTAGEELTHWNSLLLSIMSTAVHPTASIVLSLFIVKVLINFITMAFDLMIWHVMRIILLLRSAKNAIIHSMCHP